MARDGVSTSTPAYQHGFGNVFTSEAIPGALPENQSAPQRAPLGLYSELVSGTTFTAPRALNRSGHLFRLKPSVDRGPFEEMTLPGFRTPPLQNPPYPGALRWSPFPQEEAGSPDFLQGTLTVCGNGSPETLTGMALHIYRATASMQRRAFGNSDAEMLVLPQTGGLRIVTELGVVEATPGDFVLIPKGMRIRVELLDPFCRGFVCENYGHPMVLPDLGLIGSRGLANAHDFMAPVAAFEDDPDEYELVQKFGGRFWRAQLSSNPFDVVAWRGSWAPVKFDMRNFMALGTVTYDHADPSIFCALSSPSGGINGGNVDFMVIPPRWSVAEHTFRPPGFHRNTVAEILGLITGAHESRASGFPAGSFSVHNNWTPHGPDIATYAAAREQELKPAKIEGSIVFMLETCYPLRVSAEAWDHAARQPDCEASWRGFETMFKRP
jgi:homogentisate 1,2-dioxygenase